MQAINDDRSGPQPAGTRETIVAHLGAVVRRWYPSIEADRLAG